MKKIITLFTLSLFTSLIIFSCEKQDILLPDTNSSSTSSGTTGSGPSGPAPSAYTNPSCSSLANITTTLPNLLITQVSSNNFTYIGPNSYNYLNYHCTNTVSSDYLDIVFPTQSSTPTLGNYTIVNKNTATSYLNNNEVFIKGLDAQSATYYYFISGTCHVTYTGGQYKVNVCSQPYSYSLGSSSIASYASLEVTK